MYASSRSCSIAELMRLFWQVRSSTNVTFASHKTRTAEVTICIISERLLDRLRQLRTPHSGDALEVSREELVEEKYSRNDKQCCERKPRNLCNSQFLRRQDYLARLSSLLRCHWTRKPLRHLCTQTRKSHSNSFAWFNDQRLNWQTRPPRKRISTSFLVHGRRKHSAICGHKQGRRKQHCFVRLTERRWSCRQSRTGKVTYDKDRCAQPACLAHLSCKPTVTTMD